jgi:hypothetical protein
MDDCMSHGSFRDKHGLSVQLLADPEGDVCRKYGVLQEKEVDGRKKTGVLRSTFRDSDVLARVGGDEFGLLFRDAGPECPDQARRRLQRRLDEHNRRTDRRWQLRIRLWQAISYLHGGYDIFSAR